MLFSTVHTGEPRGQFEICVGNRTAAGFHTETGDAWLLLANNWKRIIEPGKMKPPTTKAISAYTNEQLNGASRGLFKLKPRSNLPMEKLQRVDLNIVVLDCKGCRLGVYYLIAHIEGVEQANVGTGSSQVTAWINASKFIAKLSRKRKSNCRQINEVIFGLTPSHPSCYVLCEL